MEVLLLIEGIEIGIVDSICRPSPSKVIDHDVKHEILDDSQHQKAIEDWDSPCHESGPHLQGLPGRWQNQSSHSRNTCPNQSQRSGVRSIGVERSSLSSNTHDRLLHRRCSVLQERVEKVPHA